MDNLRCNIERITLDDLKRRFPDHGLLPPLYKEPIIIRWQSKGLTVNNDESKDDEIARRQRFVDMTSYDNILSTMGLDFQVELSSSNSFSSNRRRTSLLDYIEEVTSSEVKAHQLSNETWYLFGETHTDEWRQKLLDMYVLPPCMTCREEFGVALSFGIGSKGSGVQWHFHGPGFSESLHGRKHFILYEHDRRPEFDPNFTSRQWMEQVYPKLKKEDLPWECSVNPGEMIYFPNNWHHATLNLDKYNSFVSAFTTEVLELEPLMLEL